MKKVLFAVLAMILVVTGVVGLSACGGSDEIVVYTNAYFAPFEYFQGNEIVGVDIDIMNKVGEKLNKKVKFVSTDFAVIVPEVAKGKVCDVGAAGITVTEERAAKVDFSTKYYTSVQYVIYKKGDANFATQTANDGKTMVTWDQLKGKKIGVQLDTTGNIYVQGEIDGVDFDGVLKDSGAECKTYESAQLAAEAIGTNLDCVVVDELPAQFIASKNAGKYECAALYYDADTATEEEYAICVTKGNTELLNAINEVLAEMMVKGEDGKSEIDKLVEKHLGL